MRRTAQDAIGVVVVAVAVGLAVWRVIMSTDPIVTAFWIIGVAVTVGFVVWAVGEIRDHCRHLEELEERVEELETRERMRRNAKLN